MCVLSHYSRYWTLKNKCSYWLLIHYSNSTWSKGALWESNHHPYKELWVIRIAVRSLGNLWAVSQVCDRASMCGHRGEREWKRGTHSGCDTGLGLVCGEWRRWWGGEGHRNTQRPNYLGKQARAQNQTLCHWGRSIGGGLRSVFGASSSSGRGGSGGLQGKEKQTDHHCYSPCPSHL